MQALLVCFLIAIGVQTAVRLWLAARQMEAVRRARGQVPPAFAATISRADQERATDYTLARVRFGQLTIVLDAVLKLLLTIGGGVAAAAALASQWLVRALARHAAGRDRESRAMARGRAGRGVADLSHRGALRLQSHHARPVRARPAEAGPARRAHRRPVAAGDAPADAARGSRLVAVC